MELQNLSFLEINETLKKHLKSPFIHYEVIGKSVKGNDIGCIVISENPEKYGIPFCKNQYEEVLQHQNFTDFFKKERKIPIIINGSLHGHEPVGAQVLLQLAECLTMENQKAARELLKQFIILGIVGANPDGLNNKTRYNENGFDLNRDFICQTQPETKSIVNLIKSCNPLAFFDLHGYVNKFKKKIGLIEPCTAPHNPNYEYDLYSKWALPMAEAMENYLLQQRHHFSSSRYKHMTGVCIPYRDLSSGWDDYAPFSAAMYSMLHGAIGCTVEAPTKEKDGIQWMVKALLGALFFLAEQKEKSFSDYHLFFHRGISHSHPQHPQHFFPAAYIFPHSNSYISERHKLVNHLVNNGVDVGITQEEVTVEGKAVCRGSFIITLSQAKAVLANTLLGIGEKEFPVKMTDLCAWNLPLLWGVESLAVKTPLSVQSRKVTTLLEEAKGRTCSTKSKKIGIVYDGGLFYKQSHAGLKSLLLKNGYTAKEIHPRELCNMEALQAIDVLVYNGFEHLFYTKNRLKPIYQKHVLESKEQQKQCKETLETFLANGGKFISIGAGAAKVTKKIFGLTNSSVNTSSWNDNAIIKVNYQQHPVTKGFKSTDIGFVYRPVWFSNTDGAEILASFSADKNLLIEGYWPRHEEAKGSPVIIKEKNKDVLLIGLGICHRAQPEYLFNLLINAITESGINCKQ